MNAVRDRNEQKPLLLVHIYELHMLVFLYMYEGNFY